MLPGVPLLLQLPALLLAGAGYTNFIACDF